MRSDCGSFDYTAYRGPVNTWWRKAMAVTIMLSCVPSWLQVEVREHATERQNKSVAPNNDYARHEEK